MGRMGRRIRRQAEWVDVGKPAAKELRKETVEARREALEKMYREREARDATRTGTGPASPAPNPVRERKGGG